MMSGLNLVNIAVILVRPWKNRTCNLHTWPPMPMKHTCNIKQTDEPGDSRIVPPIHPSTILVYAINEAYRQTTYIPTTDGMSSTSSLSLIGLSLSDDPTTSASDDVTTTAASTYSLYDPTGSPFYGLNDTVQFSWIAKGYSFAFYVCHSAVTRADDALTDYWIASSSHQLALFPDGGFTFCDVESLGESLRKDNFTNWPATCFFGMEGRDGIGHGNSDFFITTSSMTFPTPTPGQTTIFVTATRTAPPDSTVQPTTTGIQPPPIETTPGLISEPEDNHGLSGGAKAGISLCSISCVLILVGLAAWRKTVRGSTSTPKALLSGFEEAIAPIKESFRMKSKGNEPISSSIERGDGAVHEMSVPDPAVPVFELESSRHDGPHEMPDR
ncbi:Diphthamide biosynthesis protein 4 [Talaromyces marneffei ATCC 18224]